MRRPWPALGSCLLALLACAREPASPRPVALASPSTSSSTHATPPPAARAPHSLATAPLAPVAISPAPADAGQPDSPPREVRLTVHLVPIGPVPADMVQLTAHSLRSHAPVEPVVEPAQPFPPAAESTDRGRYRAERLLEWLGTLPIAPGGKVMGVTEIDIVAPKGKIRNWGILGMGSIDGRCSVISTYRMKRKWENGGAAGSLVRERLWKVAIHELGHTLGLEHCPKVGCIMEDGHGTVKTTDRDKELCDACARRFEESLRRSSAGGP
jgi:archaemetzincin